MSEDFHPIVELFPLLPPDELNALAADIAKNGLLNHIWTCEGKILDGRNRFLACQKAGVAPVFRPWSGSSAVEFAWSQNGARRHLDSSQRAAISVRMLPHLEAEAAARMVRGVAPDLDPTQKIEYGNPPKPSPVTPVVPPPTPTPPPTTARNDNTAAARAAEITHSNRQYVG